MSFLTWAHHFFVLLLFSFQCCCVPPIRFSDGEINFSASPWKMSQFLNCCLRTEKEEERRLTGRAVGEDAHLSGQMLFCFLFFLWQSYEIQTERKNIPLQVYTLSSEWIITFHFPCPSFPWQTQQLTSTEQPDDSAAFAHLTAGVLQISPNQRCLTSCIPKTGNRGNCKIGGVVSDKASASI